MPAPRNQGFASSRNDLLDSQLRAIATSCPILSLVLARWSAINLPNAWLSGSVIAQTVWNRHFGFPPGHGVKDIDLVYHDAANLSEAAEASHAARLPSLFPDLPVPLDVKNQARVHLWYEAKFGYPIAAYGTSEDAIATFPTTAGAVGIRPSADGLEIVAPFALEDLFNGIVRPNKAQITPAIYQAKVPRWRACWPGLTILDWHHDDRRIDEFGGANLEDC